MGTNISTAIDTNILNNSVDKSSSVIQKVVAESKSDSTIVQNVQLVIDGTVNCDRLIVTNDGDSVQRSLSKVTAEQYNDITEGINQSLASAITTEVEQANKKYALGLLNISTNVNTTITNNTSKIRSSIESAVSSNIDQNTSADQTIYVRVGEKGALLVKGDCLFTNEMTVTMVTTNCVNAAQQTIYKSDYGQEVIAKIAAKTKQSNEGTDVALVIGLIIVAIVVIGIITGVIKYSIDKNKKGL